MVVSFEADNDECATPRVIGGAGDESTIAVLQLECCSRSLEPGVEAIVIEVVAQKVRSVNDLVLSMGSEE
ncbi:hypothetical protein V6N11_063182 [Hibiscus sabdariffa]|uniref:Uncharacterized protein n=1 Tax=Hibiscus sabdariffa TaxID=183260 RepID=A0ABR2NX64_9ROSI